MADGWPLRLQSLTILSTGHGKTIAETATTHQTKAMQASIERLVCALLLFLRIIAALRAKSHEQGHYQMLTLQGPLTARTAGPLFLLAVSAVCLSISLQRVDAQEPAKPEATQAKLQELLKERLATVREIAKLTMAAYKTLAIPYDEVREATRMLLEAELEQCDSDKARIAVLEKFVVEAKKLEEQTGQLSKTGQAPTRTALKAKADRLQIEIALEQAKAKAAGRTSFDLRDHVALAENQLAIKRAAVKVAEAQKKMAIAKLTSARALVAKAQAAESLAEKQLKRFEELVKLNAVTADLADERRAHWEAAKARRTTADGKVLEAEAHVALEQARVEMARLEVEDAELRLKQLKVRLDPKR
jgi:hypothetical protein